MSTTQRPETECSYCHNSFTVGINRDYCSKLCKLKAQGRKLLNTVYHSHTYCALCGSRLKDIEPPKPQEAFDTTGGRYEATEDGVTFTFFSQEESHRSAIGFEYTTDNADHGLKTAYETDDFEALTDGIVCGECGNASLSEPQEDIRDHYLFEYTALILDALRERKADGEFDCEIDESIVFETVYTTGDLELAVGKARE